MTRVWQLSLALVLSAALAGCGVAVDQRTLQPKVTATPTPQPAQAVTPPQEVEDTAAPEPASAPSDATLTVSTPDTSPTQGDVVGEASGAGAVAPVSEDPVGEEFETASLAPSAAASIDELLKPAEETPPQPAIVPPKAPVKPDIPTAEVAPEPQAPPQAPADTTASTGPGEAQDDDAAEDVVGDIIWNLESASRGRPEPAPEPRIPVGPDPSLASDALEAAFAMLAQREHGLPEGTFMLPPKAPGVTRIALLVPVTGPNAALGTELQRGAELALFYVRNPKIELLVFDTFGDGAAAAAGQAVVAKADIIVGPLFSNAVVTARDIARQADIPMLALSNNMEVAANGSWLLGYVPEQQVDLLLDYALTTGRGRIGIIAEDSPFGQVLARRAIDRLARSGRQAEDSLTLTASMLADEDQLKSAVRDFSGYKPPSDDEEAPAYADLPPARFDALLFAGSASFALRTAPVLAYYDADPERVLYLGNAQWNQRQILTEPSLQGSVFTSRPTGRDETFTTLWSSAWSSRPGDLARLSFDATAMAAVLAGKKRQLWKAALESESGFSGFSGPYRLLPGGGNRRSFELRQINGGVSVILQAAPDRI